MTENYNQQFAALKAGLNAAQAEAVGHIEGPVLVLAGPGTGKTHILSTRIGEILTQTDTQPFNILCLTFTDAGVQAMRERLLSLIGPAAHKMPIYTFHAFCNKVIQDNIDLFGRQDLQPLDDLERQQVIRDIIDGLPVAHVLRRGHLNDVYFYEKHLADLFKVMKTEGWTPAHVSAQIRQYVAEMPHQKAFIYQTSKPGLYQKGDLKQEKIAETTAKLALLEAAAALLPVFEQILRGRQRYDFDDMILWVIEAFEQHPFLLRQYQEQFLYFLVDEFQDTNGAQNTLLQQLIGYWDNPNIFIVGDDDQAIYEFQGARLKSIVDFYEKYGKSLKTIVLNDNYRSSAPIVAAAQDLIQHNQLRILNRLEGAAKNKKLVASGVHAALTQRPEWCVYEQALQEVQAVVAAIEALRDQGVPLQQVAILYARHRQIEPFIELMDKKGLPYAVRRSVNILDLPLIQNFRILLAYLAAEQQRPYSGDPLLFRLLNSHFLGIQQQDILALSAFIKKENNRLAEEYIDTQIAIPSLYWRDVLNRLPPLAYENKAALADLSKKLSEWQHLSQNTTLVALIEHIINSSGLLSAAYHAADRVVAIQALNTFFAFLQAETAKQPRLDLPGFLAHLDILDKNNMPIELVKNVVHTEGVVLSTAHAAKGLEFDHVFLVDCVDSAWEEAREQNRNRFFFPDTLTYSTTEDPLEARRRLFYVAMTRAKQRLYMSYARQDRRGKERLPTQFIAEMQAANPDLIETQAVAHTAEQALSGAFELLRQSDLPKMEIIEDEYITRVLRQFQLSISALNAYLDCPLSFYFSHILKLPSAPSAATHFGSAMHYALRKYFSDFSRSKEGEKPDKAQLIHHFKRDLERQSAAFSAEEAVRYAAFGQQYLAAFYDQDHLNWHKNSVVEKAVSTEIEGVPVQGRLDKIVFNADGTAHIIDYKTGKWRDENHRRATEKNPFGGNYWRQLLFYKLLYENARAQLVRVTSAEVQYLEPDVKGVFKSKVFEFEPQDSQLLRGLVADTWVKIQARDFMEGCGKKSCVWCRFVANNFAHHRFRNENIDLLDD